MNSYEMHTAVYYNNSRLKEIDFLFSREQKKTVTRHESFPRTKRVYYSQIFLIYTFALS